MEDPREDLVVSNRDLSTMNKACNSTLSRYRWMMNLRDISWKYRNFVGLIEMIWEKVMGSGCGVIIIKWVIKSLLGIFVMTAPVWIKKYILPILLQKGSLLCLDWWSSIILYSQAYIQLSFDSILFWFEWIV